MTYDATACARAFLAKPGGVERAAGLLLGLERLALKLGWRWCPGCDDWVYPAKPCRCGMGQEEAGDD